MSEGQRMNGKPRSLRRAQAMRAAQLRGQGKTWAEIAAVFQQVYRVNPRVAMRQAHGWSQPEAAEQWTARWPDDPKSFKNFSYWEQWPGATGHAPSLDTLDRLAQLYQCRVTDLLADCYDYGGPPPRDQTGRIQISERAPLPAGQRRRAVPRLANEAPTSKRPKWFRPRCGWRSTPSGRRTWEHCCMAWPGLASRTEGCAAGPCCSRRAARSPWWPRHRFSRCRG